MPSKDEKQSSSDLQTVYIVSKTYFTKGSDDKATHATIVLGIFTDSTAAQKHADQYINHVSLTHSLYPNEDSETLSGLAHKAESHSQAEPPGKNVEVYTSSQGANLKLEVKGIHHIIVDVYAYPVFSHKVPATMKSCCEGKVKVVGLKVPDSVEKDTES